MKLSIYARQVGISYCTAFRWSKSGKMQSRRIEGIDIVENDQEALIQDFVSIVTSFYARGCMVSAAPSARPSA